MALVWGLRKIKTFFEKQTPSCLCPCRGVRTALVLCPPGGPPAGDGVSPAVVWSGRPVTILDSEPLSSQKPPDFCSSLWLPSSVSRPLRVPAPTVLSTALPPFSSRPWDGARHPLPPPGPTHQASPEFWRILPGNKTIRSICQSNGMEKVFRTKCDSRLNFGGHNT